MPLATFFNLPEAKRQTILDCAIDEFAEHDYDSASISKIVARAGIAKGSLYQYFVDKRDLHAYLLELASQKKAEMLAASPPAPQVDFFDHLLWLFEEMGRFELLYPQLARIGYRAIYGKSPLPEGIISQARLSTTSAFTRLIEQAQQRGQVRPEIDPEIAAFMFSAILTQMGDFLVKRESDQPGQSLQSPSSRRIYEQILAILQSGIEKK